jgi:hypothetical protein
VAAQYSNVVDGILLYNFATECWSCCHISLGENQAQKRSVRLTKPHSPWYNVLLWIRSTVAEKSHRRWLPAVIRVTSVRIHARGGWITSWRKGSLPTVSWRSLRWLTVISPSALRLVRIASPVNRRLSALCRVALPFHCDAVTRYGCPIVASEVATTVDTSSCALVTPCPSDRRASPLKFPAAACERYKLSPRLASQHHHAPPHPVLLPIVHQRALISNFPQNCFPPSRRVPHRGQPHSGQFILPSPSFKLSHMSTMLAEPPIWTRGSPIHRNVLISPPYSRSPWLEQTVWPLVKLCWGKWSGWIQFRVRRSVAPVMAPFGRSASSPEFGCARRRRGPSPAKE